MAGAAANPAAGPARGVATPVAPNFDVSQRPVNEAENTIAVNPTNPQNVAVMACAVGCTNGGLFLVSFDGGKTWTRRLFATAAQVGHTCGEDLAWGRYGSLWMSHLTAQGQGLCRGIDRRWAAFCEGHRHRADREEAKPPRC